MQLQGLWAPFMRPTQMLGKYSLLKSKNLLPYYCVKEPGTFNVALDTVHILVHLYVHRNIVNGSV